MPQANSERSERFWTYHHTRTASPDGTAFERHCHDCYELLFVLAGSGKAVVEGIEYSLRPGSLFLFRPMEYHYVCPDAKVAYDRYVVNFGQGIPIDRAATLPILSREGAYSGNGVSLANPEQNAAFAKIFSLLDLLDPKESESVFPMIRAVVTESLILLSRAPLACNGTEGTLASAIIEYLNENLDKDLNLEDVAKHFFISKYYLCRVFRKNTGGSVVHFINTKRVARAKQLIAEGMPATEASLEAGFHDYSVFYRACKKATGHAPVSERTDKKA